MALGSGISSLSFWTAFEEAVTASVRKLAFELRISWLRTQGDTNFAIVGTSKVGSGIVQGQVTEFTPLDQFEYFDESNRVVKMEYDRQFVEPLGGISFAIADLSLENFDGRFTPEQNATIGTAIVPNRPVQMFFGFKVDETDRTIPQFKGNTRMPRENKRSNVVDIRALDHVEFLNNTPLNKTIYTDQRSDQIIEDILTGAGISASQYELDEGINTIGFAWFEKGVSAGKRIQKICEAEEANFFQDENGILRFHNRRKYLRSPFSSTFWTIYPKQILSWERDEGVELINRCTVIAKPRTVRGNQEIWRSGIVEEIPPNSTRTLFAHFDNPVTTLSSPSANTDYEANSESDGSGSDLTSNISISETLFTDAVKLDITNSSLNTAHMTLLRLRGTPALITSEIEEVYEDGDSVEKYERNELVVNNDFIDDEDFAYYLARTLVRKYKDPLVRARVQIRANPQLQLKDRVKMLDPDFHNLVSNPSLEQNTNGYSASTGTLTRSDDIVTPYGQYTGKLVLTASSNLDYSPVKVVSGDDYRLTFALRSDVSQNVSVSVLDSGNSQIGLNAVSRHLPADELKIFSIDFTATGTDTQAKIRINFDAGAQTIYFDNFILYNKTDFLKEYRVMRIQGEMTQGSYIQTLTLREITDQEADTVGQVGITEIGNCIIGR